MLSGVAHLGSSLGKSIAASRSAKCAAKNQVRRPLGKRLLTGNVDENKACFCTLFARDLRRPELIVDSRVNARPDSEARDNALLRLENPDWLLFAATAVVVDCQQDAVGMKRSGAGALTIAEPNGGSVKSQRRPHGLRLKGSTKRGHEQIARILVSPAQRRWIRGVLHDLESA